jgi:hypothetical protein
MRLPRKISRRKEAGLKLDLPLPSTNLIMGMEVESRSKLRIMM